MNTIDSTNSIVMNNTYSLKTIFLTEAPPIPPSYLKATAAIVYTLLIILTLGGNILVCLTVFKFMRFVGVTNLFIANLAVTDLLIGLFCIPIVLISDYLLCDWPFGNFMCRFTSFTQSVFVVCTVYTLIAMSVDRYIAIIYPLHPKLTRKMCRLLIALIWIYALLFSSPIIFDMETVQSSFYRDSNNTTMHFQTSCDPLDPPPTWQKIYNGSTLVVIYLIPLCLLTIVYIRLGWQLYQSRAPGEANSERDAKIKKSRRKVIKMYFVVVIMFGVCWFPMQLYSNTSEAFFPGKIDQKYIPHIYFAFHVMAMSNSCVNPVIYAVMSSKFRDGYLHYWNLLVSCFGLFNNRFRQKAQRARSISTATEIAIHRETFELCPDRQIRRLT